MSRSGDLLSTCCKSIAGSIREGGKDEMDEHDEGPYEQRLFAVYQSCLTKGQSELEEDDLVSLCKKLRLEERTDELKLHIRKHASGKVLISFREFRDGLLSLLHETQEYPEKDIYNDNDNNEVDDEDVHRREFKGLSQNVEEESSTDENKLKNLWEKANAHSKENQDSSRMYFISALLDKIGGSTIAKEKTRRIFEKLEGNLEGPASWEEFLLVFRDGKNLEERTDAEWKANSGRRKDLESEIGTTDLTLTDFTSLLCEELKNLNESFDRVSVRWYLSLLRNILLLYEKELRNLNAAVENLRAEREKFRSDAMEANERASSLAQELDEHHVSQEKIKENLIKQIEQRHSEVVKELSKQLSSERELSATALKSKDDRLRVLQKENLEIKNKMIDAMRENQVLETENERLNEQLDKLKKSNDELLLRMKILAAEHDEVQEMETKQQEEVICLIDRIKQLQTDMVLLRDQNDELRTELESLKTRDLKDSKDFSLIESSTRSFEGPSTLHETELESFEINSKDSTGSVFQELENALLGNGDCNISNGEHEKKEEKQEDSDVWGEQGSFEKSIASELEREYERKGSETTPFVSTESIFPDSQERNDKAKRIEIDASDKSPKSRSNEILNRDTEVECDTEETERFRILNSSEPEVASFEDFLPVKSNKTTRTEKRDSEDLKNKQTGLRDYPPRKEEHGNSITDRSKFVKGETDLPDGIGVDSEVEKSPSLANDDSKNKTKITSLRDYPPRKEEHNFSTADRSRYSKSETESETLDLSKVEETAKASDFLEESKNKMSSLRDYPPRKDEHASNTERSKSVKSETDFEETKRNLEERERQLIERCNELERSLDLLKAEYEECEDYWSAKLEEERQLFEQEQKISDEKLSELIGKIAEYEELISPDKAKNGRLSPIEEKFNLEQQYLDLEEEFERWKEETKKDISRKDKEIEDLSEKLNSMKSLETIDCSVQVPEETSRPSLFRAWEDSSVSSEVCTAAKTDDFEAGTEAEAESIVRKAFRKQIEENVDGRTVFPTKGYKGDFEERLVQDILKPQRMKGYKNEIVSHHVCSVDMNVLQSLNLKLQAQERKMRQQEECFRQQQEHIERVLHYVMTQHQTEVAELQSLLRDTQEKLRIQTRVSTDQAEKLARADMLVKDLYIENNCLTAGMKRLEEHCQILTGLETESTSI